MSRDLYVLVGLIVVCKINQAPVACQCTAKNSFDENNYENDLVTMIARLQDTIERDQKQFRDSVELQLNCCAKLEQTVFSLKEDVSKLKEELLTLNKNQSIHDCQDVQRAGHNVNGVYEIYLTQTRKFINVYCDMTTDGGGWLMFQRRQDGSVYFDREWNSYKEGFGDVSGEHWLGNDYLHDVTSQKTYEVRIDMEDFASVTRYAVYSNFAIAAESDLYRLTLGTYNGTAGNSFSYHDGQVFSTKERSSCAKTNGGGWWHKNCHEVNLNGPYRASSNFIEGIEWVAWHGYFYSLKKANMKLRARP